jgi:hypothetical protein
MNLIPIDHIYIEVYTCLIDDIELTCCFIYRYNKQYFIIMMINDN